MPRFADKVDFMIKCMIDKMVQENVGKHALGCDFKNYDGECDVRGCEICIFNYYKDMAEKHFKEEN